MAFDITDNDYTTIYITDGWREWLIPKFRLWMVVSEPFITISWTDSEKGAEGIRRALKLDYNDVTFGYITPSTAAEVRLVIDIYIDSAWDNIAGAQTYSASLTSLAVTPTSGTTRFISNVAREPASVSGENNIYFAESGSITLAEIIMFSTIAGSAENISFSIRLNNTTDYLIQTVGTSATIRRFTNSAMSVPIVAGDYVEIKVVFPTWLTVPTAMLLSGYIKFVKS